VTQTVLLGQADWAAGKMHPRMSLNAEFS